MEFLLFGEAESPFDQPLQTGSDTRLTPLLLHARSREFRISSSTAGFSLAILTVPQQNAAMSSCVQKILVLTGSDSPRIQAGWHDLRRRLQDVPGLEIVGVFSASDAIPGHLQADLVVVLGGDGSILRGSRQLGLRKTPLLGVNLGRLGFLADLSPDEFMAGLPLLQRGEYAIASHLMFECRCSTADGNLQTFTGLNELLITSGGTLRMLDISLRIDSEYVTTFSCDGLIISTPVGSTAHNLSAGGPILRQDLDVFAITPICPHTLSVRPLVDAATRTYQISVNNPPAGAIAVIDGQITVPMHASDQISISRSDQTLLLARLPGHSYYSTLHRKLGWQGQLEYRR